MLLNTKYLKLLLLALASPILAYPYWRPNPYRDRANPAPIDYGNFDPYSNDMHKLKSMSAKEKNDWYAENLPSLSYLTRIWFSDDGRMMCLENGIEKEFDESDYYKEFLELYGNTEEKKMETWTREEARREKEMLDMER